LKLFSPGLAGLIYRFTRSDLDLRKMNHEK
jgi:hypothetical protein